MDNECDVERNMSEGGHEGATSEYAVCDSRENNPPIIYYLYSEIF